MRADMVVAWMVLAKANTLFRSVYVGELRATTGRSNFTTLYAFATRLNVH